VTRTGAGVDGGAPEEFVLRMVSASYFPLLGVPPSGMVIAMILRETGGVVLAGLVAGTIVSAGAVRLITNRLYGLTPTDPATFVGAVAGLALVAALAGWLPARRAANVEPLVALRFE